MKRYIAIMSLLSLAALVLFMSGCDKEKIVESTEYVHDIEYVQLPADTVYCVDTVLNADSVAVQNTDTVTVTDTVVQVDYVYDTVTNYDTVEVTIDHYDTVIVTDTVELVRCNPNAHFAMAALEYYCDQVVLEAINQEYGISDGWIFYLSEFQAYLAQQSTDVYDICGYIDYWTPDWSGFAAFEYSWRMTFTGGDPADVNNWQMSTPPATMATFEPGIKRSPDDSASRRSLR